MPTFQILTPGPLLTETHDSLDDAIESARRYLPLKRGWTTSITLNDSRTAATLRAHNSKGRVVNAFRIRRWDTDPVVRVD